jgi:predicted nucleotidyltransferase component of viral defense system
MGQEILTPPQRRFLELFQREATLTKSFYLTGGTALAAFYLNHRFSEDLDFFSEEEASPLAIQTYLKRMKPSLQIHSIDFEQSFNRNLFFLHLKGKKVLKVEFTFYPFSPIERRKRIGRLQVDSLLDIAVNKLFTISQNPRARDFIDLYFILQEKPTSLGGLLKKARIKFDWHIDPIQLGTQMMRVTEVADYPKMVKALDDRDWKGFFLKEAKRLEKEIWKS